MYKLIIFDMDGTLLDTIDDLAAAINFARKEANLKNLATKEINAYIGCGAENLIQKCFADSNTNLETAYNNFASYYNSHSDDLTKPYPKVIDTLKKITCIKTIVSNKPERFVVALAKSLGLKDNVADMIGSDTLEDLKPNPVSVNYLSKKYSIDKKDILIVGDHFTDLELGLNSNVTTVFCKYGMGVSNGIIADYTINSFDELLKVPNIPIN